MSATAAVAERPAVNKWVVALAVTFGTLMGTIDTSIINVAIPHLKGTLSATTSEIAWISTGYIVASVIVMPLTAWAGTRWGRKRIYMAGLVLFLVGSLFCGMATSLTTLVIFRVLQGAGAGALQPTEQAILRETFPAHEQGIAMSLYGLAIMLGPAVGPTLGGWIVDNYSWRWIFYINLPVGIIGLLMVAAFVWDPPYLVRSKGPVDLMGIGLMVLGLAALQFLLERGEEHGWFQSPMNVVLALVSAGALAMWVAHELETPHPSVNLRLFKDRTFASGTFISAGLMAVLFATIFLLPLYMQELLRLDAMQSGLRLMPRTLAMFVAMPIVGRLYNVVNPRVMVAFGLLLGGVTCWLMSKFTLQTGTFEILLPQLIQGIAMPFVFIPLSTIALVRISKTQMSQATGVNNLVRQIGGSLGVAIFASQLGRYIVHARVALASNVAATDPRVTGMLQQATAMFMSRGADAVTAHDRALRMIDLQLNAQSAMIGFEHVFALGAFVFWAMVPLVLLLDVPKDWAGTKGTSHEPIEL